MLGTIEKFELAKSDIEFIETIKNERGELLIGLYSIAGISLWELAKPTLNIHVIPGIESNNYKYNIPSTLYKYIKSKSKFFLKRKNLNQDLNNSEFLFLGFSEYIANDIFTPLSSNLSNNNYSLISDSEISNSYNLFNSLDDEFFLKIKELKDDFYKKNNLVKIYGWKKEFNDKSQVNFFKFLKIHFWLIGYFLNEFLPYVVISEKLILKCTNLKSIIELDIADPRSRAFVLMGEKYKIDIKTIQFGFYYRDSFEWFYLKSNEVFVWGNWFKEFFSDFYKIDKKKLICTGSPRFDRILSNPYFSIRPHFKSILIISSYEISSYKNITKTKSFKDYVQELIEFLIKEDFKIFIKVHPLEKNTSYLEKYYNKGLVVIPIEDFDKTISLVDFVLSHGSSLTFNALALGKPIIYPTSKNIVWWDDIFANLNLGVGFENFHELKLILSSFDSLKFSPLSKFEDFVEFNEFDTASKRIINYLSN